MLSDWQKKQLEDLTKAGKIKSPDKYTLKQRQKIAGELAEDSGRVYYTIEPNAGALEEEYGDTSKFSAKKRAKLTLPKADTTRVAHIKKGYGEYSESEIVKLRTQYPDLYKVNTEKIPQRDAGNLPEVKMAQFITQQKELDKQIEVARSAGLDNTVKTLEGQRNKLVKPTIKPPVNRLESTERYEGLVEQNKPVIKLPQIPQREMDNTALDTATLGSPYERSIMVKDEDKSGWQRAFDEGAMSALTFGIAKPTYQPQTQLEKNALMAGSLYGMIPYFVVANPASKALAQGIMNKLFGQGVATGTQALLANAGQRALEYGIRLGGRDLIGGIATGKGAKETAKQTATGFATGALIGGLTPLAQEGLRVLFPQTLSTIPRILAPTAVGGIAYGAKAKLEGKEREEILREAAAGAILFGAMEALSVVGEYANYKIGSINYLNKLKSEGFKEVPINGINKTGLYTRVDAQGNIVGVATYKPVWDKFLNNYAPEQAGFAKSAEDVIMQQYLSSMNEKLLGSTTQATPNTLPIPPEAIQSIAPEVAQPIAPPLEGSIAIPQQDIQPITEAPVYTKPTAGAVSVAPVEVKPEVNKPVNPFKKAPDVTDLVKPENRVTSYQDLKDKISKVSPDTIKQEQSEALFSLIEGAAAYKKMSPDDYVRARYAGVEKVNRGGERTLAQTMYLDDAKVVLRAFKKNNVVSMAHEIAHVFRRDLDPIDMAVAERWAGVKDGKWTVKAEEKFAKGFEVYLEEGKAPNQKLRGVFEKFKGWVTEVYQNLRNQKTVKLSNEIRQVFDKVVSGRAVETDITQTPSVKADTTIDYTQPIETSLAEVDAALKNYNVSSIAELQGKIDSVELTAEQYRAKYQDTPSILNKYDEYVASVTQGDISKMKLDLQIFASKQGAWGQYTPNEAKDAKKYIKKIREIAKDKYLPDTETSIRPILDEIDLPVTFRRKDTIDRLKKLKQAILANPDNTLPLDVIESVDILQKKSWRDMTFQEIKDAHDTLMHYVALDKAKYGVIKDNNFVKLEDVNKDLESTIKPSRELKRNLQKKGMIFDATNDVYNGVDKNVFMGRGKKIALMDLTSPYTLFKIAQGSKDGVFSKYIYDDVSRATMGHHESMFKATDEIGSIVGKTDVAKWSRAFTRNPEARTIKVKNYTLKLTPSQLMAIYLTYQQPYSRFTIAEHGFRLDSVDGGKPIVLGKDGMDQLISNLKPEEIRIATEIRDKVLNSQLKPLINNASVILDGFERATQLLYYPIHRYKGDIKSDDIRKQNPLYKLIQNTGIVQERVSPDLPLQIRDFFEDVAGAINSASLYGNLALPLRNASSIIRDKNLIDTMNKYGNDDYRQAIDKYVQDMNGIIEKPLEVEKTASRMLNRYAAGNIGINVRTIAAQTISFVNAMQFVDPKYMAKAISFKTDWAYIYKANPTIRQRNEGYMTREIGEISNEFFTQKMFGVGMQKPEKLGDLVDVVQQIPQLATAPIRQADMITVGKVAMGIKYQLEAQGLTGKALDKEFARLTNLVIDNTQPTANMNARSAVGRGKDITARTLSLYMSQRNNNYSNMIDAYTEYQYSGKTTADKVQFVKRAMIVNLIAPAMYAALYAGYDKLFKKANAKTFKRRFAESVTSNITIVGQAVNSVISKFERGTYGGFDYDNPVDAIVNVGLDTIAELAIATHQFINQNDKKIGQYGTSRKGEYEKGDLKYPRTLKRFIKKATLDLPQAYLGIPTGIFARQLEDIMNLIKDDDVEDDE